MNLTHDHRIRPIHVMRVASRDSPGAALALAARPTSNPRTPNP